MIGIGGKLAMFIVLAGNYPDEASVDADVEEILEDRRYSFCQEEGEFTPVFLEYAWCTIVPEYDNCPGYAEACERGRQALMELEGSGGGEFDWESFGGGGSGHGDDDTTLNPNAGGTDEEPPEAREVPDFSGMSGFARVLFWILLALGVGYIAYLIIKNRSDHDDEPEKEGPELGEVIEGGPDLVADAARKVVERDVFRLLERAREAAGRGQFEEAINDTYAALLRRLEGDGAIEMEEHATNGDYVRQLRRHPQIQSEQVETVREIVREVEAVQFGDVAAEPSIFERVMNRVVPLVKNQLFTILGLLFVGVALTACPRNPLKTDEHKGLAGLSTDPLGERALVQLMRRYDIEASHRSASVEELSGKSKKRGILLYDNVWITADEWEILHEWVDEGGTLIVASGGSLPDWIEVEYAGSQVESTNDALYPGPNEYRLPEGMRTPPINAVAGTDVYSSARPFLIRKHDADCYEGEYGYDSHCESENYAMVQYSGSGMVYVFADDMLFTNASMATSNNAAGVLQWLQADLEHVEIVNEWTGAGAETPLDVVKENHLTPLILQALALLILFYLWKGAAFGKLRDPAGGERRAFSEHVRALGQQYAKARATSHVVGIYSGYILERLRERLGARSGGGLHGLAEALSQRTGLAEPTVMRILVQAHSAREGQHVSPGVKEDLEFMRQLSSLLGATKKSR